LQRLWQLAGASYAALEPLSLEAEKELKREKLISASLAGKP
jgi:hypothetical protein